MIEIDKDYLVDLYVNQGLSMKRISKILNCGQTTIFSRINKYGIKSRPAVKPKKTPPKRETLVKLHKEQGLTYKQISKRFGVDRNLVAKWMSDYNISCNYFKNHSHRYNDTMNYSFNEIQKQFIVGSVLGDSYISPGGVLEMHHGIKQLPYLKYKINFMKGMFRDIDYLKNSGHPSCKAKTFTNLKLKKYRSIFYPDGFKIIPSSIKEYITPLSIAILIMDDGSLVKNSYIVIYTYSFTKDENIMLSRMIKDNLGVKSKASKVIDKGKIYYKLMFGTKESKKLSNIIRPYFIDEMKYKVITDPQRLNVRLLSHENN